jgi:hypothetical protein
MNMNNIQQHSRGAYSLLYKLEQLTADQVQEAAPLLQYQSGANLSAEIKELREYVRALEMSMFPRELIG